MKVQKLSVRVKLPVQEVGYPLNSQQPIE